jgi:hypothetical protein
MGASLLCAEVKREEMQTRGKSIVPVSKLERRAANVDAWVKKHLAEERAKEEHKRQMLKALRMSKDASRVDALSLSPSDSMLGGRA